jgi:hypothetical protein
MRTGEAQAAIACIGVCLRSPRRPSSIGALELTVEPLSGEPGQLLHAFTARADPIGDLV